MSRWIRAQIHMCQAIELPIGQMKNEGNLGKSYSNDHLGGVLKAILS
ncbi:hypothetical protein DB42_BQ00370 [Neochlamydia sp. EPS4]|nr:hypothetical protein [Neochlamydia sp. EPS4]KIC73802.1 hypothetical protein DB42_BQ00370 [Neochlamydia sp. EPS4]